MIRDKLPKCRLKKCVGLLAVVAVLVIACPVPVAANGVVVSIPNASAEFCKTVVVPIRIDGVVSPGLGAAQLSLNYDSSVVEVAAVADGDLANVGYTPLPDANAAGELVMTWFWTALPPGPTGDLIFANITLHAVGSADETSLLDLEVTVLADTTPVILDPTEVDGVFTVLGEAVPPTVVGKFPTGYNVPINTLVTATFSEAMAAATITTDSFTLAGNTVSGTVTYHAGTYTATFTPDADLDYSHRYTAALSRDITDLAGNPLSQTYSWSFTTVKAPHLELAKSVSPSTIGQKGSGISPEETTVTLTVSGAGEPGKVAGEDIVVTDVLRSYINLEDEPHDATITHNPDGTTTLVWELEGSLSTTDDPWTVSFDISSDKCGRVLVNVVDESKVTYTDYADDPAEALFPETDLYVRCPREVVGVAVLPGPASFSASYLHISPQQVLPNQQVEISINISNTGEERGSHTVALYINGYAEQSQTVGVSPGSSKAVVFKVTKLTPGTYQVNVEGMPGQFTVLAPAAEAPTAFGGPLGTGGIIAIVVVAIVLVCGLVFGLRRE